MSSIQNPTWSGLGMTGDPRVQSESSNGASARNSDSAGQATQFFSEPSNLTQVAQTLAAHGGGAVSVDLALDLVLNEVVEQARNATGASGAAVALFREGELSCRATAGENSPDLGVRVDATSGLAGDCFTTGEIQQCQDTETDDRVNAEACRRLGVRSMLIAPLVDQSRAIGIIQVFSAWPNAFGKREISALQVLAGRIAEKTREAEAGVQLEQATPEPMMTAQSSPTEPEPGSEKAGDFAVSPSGEEKPSVVWNSVLIVLVIATAIALGIVIGWRRAAKVAGGTPGKPSVTSAAAQAAPVPLPDVPSDASKAGSSLSVSAEKPAGAATPGAPAGGLVVTENGKVVYRSSATRARASSKAERTLVHRVEPEYPADAKARHIQGSVVLDVQVLNSGDVGNIGIVSGDPLLSQAAVDAVKQWRYEPDTADGHGVESQTRVTVKFTLPSS